MSLTNGLVALSLIAALQAPAPTPRATSPSPAATPQAVAPPIPKRLPLASEIPAHDDLIASGAFAPDFKLARIDAGGGTFQLSDVVSPDGHGKPDAVLVAFMASWCGICHASLPSVKALLDEHGARLAIVVVSTDSSADDAKKEAKRLADTGLSVPVVLGDDATIKAWLGTNHGVPRFFFLNKIGEIVVHDAGFGANVAPRMPKQARFAIEHPQYVVH